MYLEIAPRHHQWMSTSTQHLDTEHERLKATWHAFQKTYKSQTGHKMTQVIAAEKLGVSPGAVGQWLNGDETIPDARLVEFCALMNTDPNDIRTGIPIGLTITDEESHLLELYRNMPESLRANWVGIAEVAVDYKIK